MSPSSPRSTQQNQPTLLILALIMMINALSYGVIIPLVYPLAERFGLGPTGLSWLLASFSLAQFLATPVIGRLSDRFGRKPLLLLSVLGSSLSMALMALAINPVSLFLARIIDGVTGGNNSVAQAAIADSTSGADRAKAFGLLGAAFGFGFLFGPAIGGLLGHINLMAPFWFASGLALAAVCLGAIFFKETLSPSKRKAVQLEHLFHGKQLFTALLTPMVGILFVLTLILSMAQSSFIIGIQTTSFDVLKLSTRSFGLILGIVGLVSVIMQAGVIRVVLKLVSQKEWLLVFSLLGSTLTLAGFYFHQDFAWFVSLNVLYTIFISLGMPVISGLISERTKAEDQGYVMGLNQAYMALGMIIGPLLAGMVATSGLANVFLLSTGMLGIGLIACGWLFVRGQKINL
jgi:MFS family permease